jgi:hypothetical protein
VGSGYGDPLNTGEGTTFYTLDALTGDVIATVDVEAAAAANGLGRSFTWKNALVANAVGWNPAAFTILKVEHSTKTWPADGMQIRRVYFGDLYGRLWKVLPTAPTVAIPIADLGADQPVATAVSVLAIPAMNWNVPPPVQYPYVYVTSGADSRQKGPFKIFGFKDEGNDTKTTTDGTVATGDITTFKPAVLLFDREFDQGAPEGSCGYTEETFFRGTVQPDGVREGHRQREPGACVLRGHAAQPPQHQVRSTDAARLRKRQIPVPVAVRLDHLCAQGQQRDRRRRGQCGLRPERRRGRRLPHLP